MTLQDQALAIVRDGWDTLTAQWDDLRQKHPELDDLVAVVQVQQKGCAIMPRRRFLKQFNPPSGFEYLKRPAGDVDPPKPRASVMWVLALGPEDHTCFRISREQMNSSEARKIIYY